MVTLIFLRGLCDYVQVNILTLSPPRVLKSRKDPAVVLYLSDKLWMASVCDIILSDVSVQPVTEVHEAVIQGQQDIGDQT